MHGHNGHDNLIPWSSENVDIEAVRAALTAYKTTINRRYRIPFIKFMWRSVVFTPEADADSDSDFDDADLDADFGVPLWIVRWRERIMAEEDRRIEDIRYLWGEEREEPEEREERERPSTSSCVLA